MPPFNRPQYRVVAITLLVSDVTDADRIAEALRTEGWPNASRSLVIREALGCLSDDLRGKTPEEVFSSFIERRGRRLSRREPGGAA